LEHSLQRGEAVAEPVDKWVLRIPVAEAPGLSLQLAQAEREPLLGLPIQVAEEVSPVRPVEPVLWARVAPEASPEQSARMVEAPR
jgi:hypothetical protein